MLYNSILVRLYEPVGRRVRARVHFGVPVRRVREATLLEDDLEDVPVDDGAVHLALGGWEVRTLRATPA